MTVRQVTVDLLDDDETLLVEGLSVLPGSYYTEEESDAGACEVIVPNAATGSGDVDRGRLLRFNVDGEPDHTALIEKVAATVRSTDNKRLVRKVTGRDWVAELGEAPVEPPFGIGQPPVPQVIHFDWRHPQVLRTGWTAPVWTGPVVGATRDPFDNPWVDPGITLLRPETEAWPDPLAGWMAAEAPDDGGSHPEGATHYAQAFFDTTPGPAVSVFTGDDNAQLALQGILVDEGAPGPVAQFASCTAHPLPAVGDQLFVAVRVKNSGTPGNVDNPMGWVHTLYQDLDGTARLSWENVVARTGPNPAGSQLVGGGWLSWAGAAPSFTPGYAFYTLFAAAQLSGHLPGWTLGFTATHDSAGEPWISTDALTARVNDDSLLDVATAWSAQGWWTFAARPGERVLDAWNWRTRGSYPAAAVTWADNRTVASLTDTRSR